MNLNDPSTWTEDDKWKLFATACWFCGALRDPDKVALLERSVKEYFCYDEYFCCADCLGRVK